MSIYSGVCRIYTPCHSVHLRYRCISVHLPSLLRDALGGRDRACLEMHLEAGIERVWRCTWRPGSSELRDALGGRDRASVEMHLETEDRVNSEMHLEAEMKRVWRCTWRA